MYGQLKKVYEVDNPTFLDYSSKVFKKHLEYEAKLLEINSDIISITKIQLERNEDVSASGLITTNLASSIDLSSDINFAMNAFVMSNGTAMAIKYILNRIERRVEDLKTMKTFINQSLSFATNSQVVYLGNDARKEIDRYLRLTEEWLEEAQKL
tara:strand:- start:258 stop:719 length:462 start_codon:yes stop_codon:yes gene_type:complete